VGGVAELTLHLSITRAQLTLHPSITHVQLLAAVKNLALEIGILPQHASESDPGAAEPLNNVARVDPPLGWTAKHPVVGIVRN